MESKLPPPLAAPFSSLGDMAELSLLVPSWQANALLEAAESQGMTMAQFLRRVINQTLVAFPPARMPLG